MIEKVEEFSAKLYTKLFTQHCVLDHRKIGVTEARSDNHIAAEITGTQHCPEHRRIKPLLDGADRRNRSGDVGPERIGDAVHSAVAGNDVDRTAALELNYRSQLPAFEKRIAVEWQIVYSVPDKPVTGVKIREPAIAAQVIAVLANNPARTERVVIQRLRPGIREVELQTVRLSL